MGKMFEFSRICDRQVHVNLASNWWSRSRQHKSTNDITDANSIFLSMFSLSAIRFMQRYIEKHTIMILNLSRETYCYARSCYSVRKSDFLTHWICFQKRMRKRKGGESFLRCHMVRIFCDGLRCFKIKWDVKRFFFEICSIFVLKRRLCVSESEVNPD